MKILVYSSSYDLSGSSIRATMIVRGLNGAGQNVAISGFTIPEYLQNMFKTYLFPYQSNARDGLIKSAIDFQPDWIIGITEDSAQWIIDASKVVNCRSAIDIHAIPIFEILELGKGYGSRKERILRSIKNAIGWLKSDLVITCSPNVYKLVCLIKGKRKVLDITGLVDIKNFLTNNSAGDKERIQVYYIGNYYKWQGVNLYLDAARIVYARSDRFEFNILGSVGRTSYDPIFNHPLIQEGKVKVYGPVSHDQVPRYMESADILVIPRPRMFSTFFGFPSKLCEYMTSGKAIIATDLSPHRWALKNPKCGTLCPPNARGIAKAILNMDMEEAMGLAETAKCLAMERYDYLKQCKTLSEELVRRI